MAGLDPPASQKDWKAINRSKPEDRKKVDQKTRRFLPLTDAVIENHLLGKETIGVYPLPIPLPLLFALTHMQNPAHSPAPTPV
jgi:hypothetical protein